MYVPTPERPVTLKVSRTDLPNEVAFMEVSQLEKFVESCKLTPIDLIHAIIRTDRVCPLPDPLTTEHMIMD